MSSFPSMVPNMFKPRAVSGPGFRRQQQDDYMPAPNLQPGQSSGGPPVMPGYTPSSATPVTAPGWAPNKYTSPGAVMNNITKARGNAATAAGLMGPQIPYVTPTAPGSPGGHISATLTDEQLASLKRIAPGQYNNGASAPVPFLPTPGAAPNMVSRDYIPTAPTPMDPTVQRMLPGIVARNTARGDMLTDSSLSAPGWSADQRNKDAVNTANVARTNAETSAITATAGQGTQDFKTLQSEHDKLRTAHEGALRQITDLQNKLNVQNGTNRPGPATKPSPTTKPSDVVSADRERRLSSQSWLQHFRTFKDDPDFQAMPIKEKIALAKEMAGINTEANGADAASSGGGFYGAPGDNAPQSNYLGKGVSGGGAGGPVTQPSGNGEEIPVPDETLSKFGLRRANGQIVNGSGEPFSIRMGPNGNPHAYRLR